MIYHLTTTKLILIEESVFFFYDALFCGYLICIHGFPRAAILSTLARIKPNITKYLTPVSTQFQTSLPICEPKINSDIPTQAIIAV